MKIRLKNNSRYLEWIFLDGKNTIASKKTGCSYGWFMKQNFDIINANNLFITIYDFLLQKDFKLSNSELLGLWYHYLSKAITKQIVENIHNSFPFIIPTLLRSENDISKGGFISIEDIDKEETQTTIKLFGRFAETIFELQQYISSTGYINASSKLISLKETYHNCGEEVWLDKLYYGDIDQIDGQRLKSYNTLLSIKSFQKEEEMMMYTDQAFTGRLQQLIEYQGIDTIIIVPNNTSKRIAYNEYINQHLNAYITTKTVALLPYDTIEVNDFPGRKAQKSIRGGICERIENADKLFDCKRVITGNNILIIDDAFGSGATMNMISKKIKNNLPQSTIIGLSIVGSMRKGFDVLSEV